MGFRVKGLRSRVERVWAVGSRGYRLYLKNDAGDKGLAFEPSLRVT